MFRRGTLNPKRKTFPVDHRQSAPPETGLVAGGPAQCSRGKPVIPKPKTFLVDHQQSARTETESVTLCIDPTDIRHNDRKSTLKTMDRPSPKQTGHAAETSGPIHPATRGHPACPTGRIGLPPTAKTIHRKPESATVPSARIRDNRRHRPYTAYAPPTHERTAPRPAHTIHLRRLRTRCMCRIDGFSVSRKQKRVPAFASTLLLFVFDPDTFAKHRHPQRLSVLQNALFLHSDLPHLGFRSDTPNPLADPRLRPLPRPSAENEISPSSYRLLRCGSRSGGPIIRTSSNRRTYRSGSRSGRPCSPVRSSGICPWTSCRPEYTASMPGRRPFSTY